MAKKKNILYFIDGPVPTAADIAACDKLFGKFRNAQQVAATDHLEACDAVAGCVPAAYAKLPRADKPVAATPAESAPVPASEPQVGTGEGEALPPISEAPAQEAPAEQPVANDGPTAEEIAEFSAQSIDVIVGLVKKGKISAERALQLEAAGKNRPTCIKRLSDL